jgi:hypothetical protein
LTDHIPVQKECKQHLKNDAANEGDSQDSAATLFEDYIREQGCLGKIEKELYEELKTKKYGQQE